MAIFVPLHHDIDKTSIIQGYKHIMPQYVATKHYYTHCTNLCCILGSYRDLVQITAFEAIKLYSLHYTDA